ncbi:MAG: error-prone DNA polymerase [Anaerolineae bacterium]|nr:MAG: error-prone DNA polymerase [Anaerolineae bacterium]
MAGYFELHAHSYYSFLDGASSPQALLHRAAALDMPAMALTDHDGLYGIVQFVMEARELGIRPIIGAELTMDDGYHLTLLVEDAQGYSNLCRLISRAQLDHSKGQASLSWELLERHCQGLTALSGCHRSELAKRILQNDRDSALEAAQRHRDLFGPEHYFIELQRHLVGSDKTIERGLLSLADHLGLEIVATNDVHYATLEARPLQDVLSGIKHILPIHELGGLRRPNAEFYLKSPAEMRELFSDLPQALENTMRIAERCRFELDLSEYRFPRFPVEDSFAYLRQLSYEGLAERYHKPSPNVIDQLEHELSVIDSLDLEEYFLIVWDICTWARRQGYPVQGRGSSANSLVAYCLGITRVDPIGHNLLFERFLSHERGGLPDIDVDFSRAGREAVIQYVYERYGEEYTAMVCNVVTYRSRSAVRDVGKALGFPAPVVGKIAKALHRSDFEGLTDKLRRDGDGLPWDHYATFIDQIKGVPRHLSIHVGGMVITAAPLVEIAPIERASMPGRVVTQWDKDDIEDAGLIKIDLLSLRTLDVVSETIELISQHEGVRIDSDNIGLDDPAVYRMISEADTIGVFQVESRAQMQMLPKMKPACFEDLMIEVAIVRPGPTQGKMVHPYLNRRQGLEPVEYLHPALEPVLEETLGVVLYQEQVLGVAHAIGGFTPGEGDLLRRAMTRKRSYEEIEKMRSRFVEGALLNGLSEEVGHDVFDKIAAFGGYGFCKSHAAAFARTTYETAYLKYYHPVAFYTAYLNHEPLGFYAPEVIVEAAKREGISVHPVDINRSETRCIIQDGGIRLGFNYVRAIGSAGLARLDEDKVNGAYRSLEEFSSRVDLTPAGVENLIMVGAFDCFGIPRRDLLWQFSERREKSEGELPIGYPEEVIKFPDLTDWENTYLDYVIQGLTTGPHLTTHFREEWDALGVLSSRDLPDTPDGSRVMVAGLVITRQAPSTAKGHVFISLEDEYGTVNAILRPHVFKRFKPAATRSSILVLEGSLVHDSGVINVLVESIATGIEDVVEALSHDFR